MGRSAHTSPVSRARASLQFSSEAMAAQGPDVTMQRWDETAPGAADQGAQASSRPSPEAALAPAAAVTATWLHPGSPQATVHFAPNGTMAYNGGPLHGAAALVGGGQLLLCFHHLGETHRAVPHLLRPVTDGPAPLVWRSHTRKEVLLLRAPLAGADVPTLAGQGQKHGLWFVPGRPSARAELASGGCATVDGAAAWWGLAEPPAGGALGQALLVLLLPTANGDEPVVLRPLGPGIWRCSARRCVFLEDDAPPPRLQSADLPRYVPREVLKYGLLWLHPGRAPQTVNLTTAGKVAWCEVGGNSSGPANGAWQHLGDGGGRYLSVTFNAFGDETQLRSTVLQRATAGSDFAWRAAGTVDPSGDLRIIAPEELTGWHVLALVAQLPVKRPAF